MNEHLKNKMVNVIEKDVTLTEDTINDISNGVDSLTEIRGRIDTLIDEAKQETIQNSAHLLLQRIMGGDKDAVIEMLNNNRHVIDIFNFTDKINELLSEYGKYKVFYAEDYPEIKKIKENFALKDKELLPLLKEIIDERK